MKVNIDILNKNSDDDVCEVQITGKDCYSLYYTLAKVIHPALVHFRSDLHSCAGVDNDDVPDHLWTTDVHCLHKWEWVLDEMIWGFDQIANDKQEEDNLLAAGELTAIQTYHTRLQNSTRLFGKYYKDLWN